MSPARQLIRDAAKFGITFRLDVGVVYLTARRGGAPELVDIMARLRPLRGKIMHHIMGSGPRGDRFLASLKARVTGL